MAETRTDVEAGFDGFIESYGVKYENCAFNSMQAFLCVPPLVLRDGEEVSDRLEANLKNLNK
jgi:hypothetical protein